MQLGIRLHDVNSGLGGEAETMEKRAEKAREEGFSCVHLAFSKVIKGVTFDDAALTEGLAHHVKRVFSESCLDVAVLGCYLNLAHPDPARLQDIQSRYFGHIRVAALMSFMRGLEPVLDCAERYGVSLAIEPVWNHIVYTPQVAAEVVKSMASRNLRIIFDPVNLLAVENLDRREAVLGEAMELLCDSIAVVHLKDYTLEGGKLKSIAAGTGEMDYSEIMRFIKARKPYIQATLENTTNENAVASRKFLEEAFERA